MKIVQLTAENLKRIRAVEIKPDGSLVQITGRNAQGKTSVLDAITYALGGAGVVCDRPIRDGAKKAKVVCELDDITVTRTFTAGGGGTLTVVAKDGSRINSPQAALDALVGKLSFDPLAFVRMAPKVQGETLRALVGLDFTAIDAERKAAYDKRTLINRDADRLDAELKRLPLHIDMPEAEVSVSELMSQLLKAKDANAEVDRRERELRAEEDGVARARQKVADLEAELAKARATLAGYEAAAASHRDQIKTFARIDTAPIEKQIADSGQINQKIRENHRLLAVVAEHKKTSAESNKLTASIEALDEKKATMLESASFPIDGLSFDDNGVLLNNIPFTQASGAEQLRTSVAIGLASNPKLRVLLIRDGSLLDAESLEMVAQMAEGYQAQVWIERVADGNPVGVVIEDGMVTGAPIEAETVVN